MNALADLALRCEVIVGSPHVITGDAVCRYRIGEATPMAAVRPADEREVSRLLALAWIEGLAVVPWGGGLHQTLGGPPSRYDLALDLTRLDRVVDHQPGDMTATVQAGIRLGALDDHLGQHGQFLPLDPPRGDQATVGGVLATNLSGPLRCRYGTARDLVLGIRIVHADGTITKGGGRVVKNASAYDIPKLYLGAHGTLGVIVEATVRVYPRAQAESGEVFAFPDVSAAQAMADRILHSPLVPTRVELVEGTALRLGGRGSAGLAVTFAGVAESVTYQREAASEMAASHAGEAVAVAELPELLQKLRDFPWANEDPSSPSRILKNSYSPRQLKKVQMQGGERSEARGVLAGTSQRLGSAPTQQMGLFQQPGRVLWRGGVLPADCGKAMEAVQNSSGGGCLVGTAATVSAGVVRGVIASDDPDRLASSVQAARRALEALGGYLVLLDAPSRVRAAASVWGPAPASLSWMQGLRRAFDERAIINPGRFLDGI